MRHWDPRKESAVSIIPDAKVLVNAAVGLIAQKASALHNEYIYHQYIVIEYGRKSSIYNNFTSSGFEFCRYIRIEFGCDGYSITEGSTDKYWETFCDEKEKKCGRLGRRYACEGNIENLMEVIAKHNEVYNIVTNNCQHFAREILIKMT